MMNAIKNVRDIKTPMGDRRRACRPSYHNRREVVISAPGLQGRRRFEAPLPKAA